MHLKGNPEKEDIFLVENVTVILLEKWIKGNTILR